MELYDYGIIGGGPAGYTAGMMLANSGHSVVLFEKDKLGGTCLNRGCIPTKSFLHSSEVFAEIKSASKIGVEIGSMSFDFSKVVEKKDNAVEKIRKSLELAVKNSGVVVVNDEACVKEDCVISTLSGEYKVGKIILATGSKPREIKGLEFDGKFILSSDDILNLKELPKSVLIVGSGAIGLEWSRVLHNFGVEVTLVELAEHLVPLADVEVSKRVERIFKQKKLKFYTKDFVKEITEDRVVKLNSGAELTPDFLLVAAGREAVCPKCSCDAVIGDACGEIQLAHYAVHQAKALALGIPFDKTLVPSVIYGEPEIAWVGLREQDCDETYNKTMLPITALGKAWCDDATDGFIKLITKDNLICGASIVSKEASSLIHIILSAIQNKIRVDEMKKMCFAHPTYAEGIFELLMRQ